jgi:hypothetical protein
VKPRTPPRPHSLLYDRIWPCVCVGVVQVPLSPDPPVHPARRVQVRANDGSNMAADRCGRNARRRKSICVGMRMCSTGVACSAPW